MESENFLFNLLLSNILFSCQIPPTTILEKGVNIAHGVGIVIHQNTVHYHKKILAYEKHHNMPSL